MTVLPEPQGPVWSKNIRDHRTIDTDFRGLGRGSQIAVIPINACDVDNYIRSIKIDELWRWAKVTPLI